MNDSIFWYQSADSDADDIIVVNGKILNKGEGLQEKFHELYKLSGKAVSKPIPWHGQIGKCHFVKGLLNASDKYGRTLSFMFAAPNDSWKESLQNTIDVIGYELSDDTLECLKTNKIQYNDKILKVMACLLLIITLLIIIYSYGK